MTSTMDIENTRYFILDRVSKRKRQHRDERSNKTRKQDNSKEKKNIFEWIDIKQSKEIEISFLNERDLVV